MVQPVLTVQMQNITTDPTLKPEINLTGNEDKQNITLQLYFLWIVTTVQIHVTYGILKPGSKHHTSFLHKTEEFKK
jgi:hypothetical protein